MVCRGLPVGHRDISRQESNAQKMAALKQSSGSNAALRFKIGDRVLVNIDPAVRVERARMDGMPVVALPPFA